MIPDSTIAEIKNRIDIEEVVSDFVTLKKKGQNLWACCPFHNEKTPSFSVSPAKGFYKCFGCGRGGDAIDFVMEIEKINYVEALKYLARKYGIEVKEEELSADELREQSERESLYIVLNFAKDFFVKSLLESEEGRKIGLAYFRERDINEEIIKTFELGYALDSWDALLQAAKAAGHSTEMLEKAGLILPSKKSGEEGRYYDRFRGRVVFPIHNVSGRVIAFGARALKKDDKPKYLNSPETPVYHKSKIIYGIYQARQAIRQADNCYLVEGYTDVTRLHQIGIENVVASSGTSLTEDQVRLIGRFAGQLTVLYDGDAAGLQASLRGIDLILANGLDVKVVVFPAGHDPDSYARELGTNEFRHYLEDNARDFIHFKVELAMQEAGDDPVKKAAAIKDIVESIAKIPDQLKRNIYIQAAAAMLEMEERVLVAEMNKFLLKARKEAQRRQQKQPPLPEELLVQPQEPARQEPVWDLSSIIHLQEQESIRLLLNYGLQEVGGGKKLYEYLFTELEDVQFSHPVYARIFDEFKQRLQQNKTADADYFLEHRDAEIRKTVIDLVHARFTISEHWQGKHKIYVPRESEEDHLPRVAFTNLMRLKQRIVRKLLEDNLEKLKESSSPTEQEELQTIHYQLKEEEKLIAASLGNVILK